MSFLAFLAAPANAPFTIAAGIALLFALLSMTGVLGLLAGGGEDADHEATADHDVDGDGHGGEADGAQDGDPGQDAEHDHHETGGRTTGAALPGILLGGLGVGRIPLSLIWQTFAVVFGLAGIALNARWLGTNPPLVSLAWTLPSATVVAYAAVAGLSRVLGPVLSSEPCEATSRRQLVGSIGVVISSQVTPSFGEVRIKDRSGHDLRVVVRLASGCAPVVEKSRVVVIDYDKATQALLVSPLDELAGDSGTSN